MKTIDSHKFSITFLTEDNTEYKICYNLFNTPYILDWLNLWEVNCKENKIDAWFVNSTWKKLPQIIEEGNLLISKINYIHKFELPTISLENLSNTLNFLHHKFENHIYKVSDEGNLLEKLNYAIHKIEHIMLDNNTDILNFLSIVKPAGSMSSIPLAPEYKLFASNYSNWGDLVLGYATTGKNWKDAITDNDTALIETNDISNKIDILPEFYCSFNYNGYYDSRISHLLQVSSNQTFYKLYQKLDAKLRDIVPIGNLNEISYGKLVLGHIDYKEFFKKESTIDADRHYYDLKYRASIIKEWNVEVFSKFKKVINVEIINLTE